MNNQDGSEPWAVAKTDCLGKPRGKDVTWPNDTAMLPSFNKSWFLGYPSVLLGFLNRIGQAFLGETDPRFRMSSRLIHSDRDVDVYRLIYSEFLTV